jgi:hypothetical protein
MFLLSLATRRREIVAEGWFRVGPKATGTARFGGEPLRNLSVGRRSVAVIGLASREGDAVRFLQGDT